MATLAEGKLFIDGQLRPASNNATFADISPWTGEEVGRAADASLQDMQDAIAAARHAFDTTDWSTDHPKRIRTLRRFADIIRRNFDRLSDILRKEAGAPLGLIHGPQLKMPLDMLDPLLDMVDAYPWQDDRGVLETTFGTSRRIVQSESAGVVGAITPWNMPLQQNVQKGFTALAAGCTVVLKPAPDTPLAGAVLGELAREVGLPAGVYNVVISKDPAAVGEILIADPRVDVISFTGSTAVGRRIMEKGAATLKRVGLELGGKSAIIILDDANFPATLAAGGTMVTLHCGQGCALTTRMLVPRSRYEEAKRILIDFFNNYKYGDPNDPRQIMGPLISAKQLSRVRSYMDVARSEGATIAAGGESPMDLGNGFFFKPTLITDVTNDMRIAREEIFGPVLCLIPFADDADAIRIANDSPYGLSGAVYSGDVHRARKVADAIRAGTISVNGGAMFGPDVPFGGYKQSGVGRELGPEGFKEFIEVKTIGIPL
jgi:aldehyde dehydrogenase (NAD+)